MSTKDTPTERLGRLHYDSFISRVFIVISAIVYSMDPLLLKITF